MEVGEGAHKLQAAAALDNGADFGLESAAQNIANRVAVYHRCEVAACGVVGKGGSLRKEIRDIVVTSC